MKRLFLLTFFLLFGATAHANTRTMVASWYGPGLQGNLMANGEMFDMYDPTVAAHKTLPFGTRLRLTNPDTDQTIIVVVQDRGPFVKGRQLDVSKAAAERLGFIEAGVAELIVEQLDEAPAGDRGVPVLY